MHALDLYVGPPLGALAEDLGLADVTARYEERRGEAVEALTDVRLALGEHAQLPAALAPEIARQPYRERLRAQLAVALYRADRPVEALRSIDEARRLLREDVGADPGPELRRLEAAILAHDEASLAWTPPPGAERRGARRRRRPTTRTAFGRVDELARAGATLDGLATRGAVLVVGGEAGIGKSALLRCNGRARRGAGDSSSAGIAVPNRPPARRTARGATPRRRCCRRGRSTSMRRPPREEAGGRAPRRRSSRELDRLALGASRP